MASTQVVSLNIGQMKRVHFPTESDDRPVENIPHFVSPKKMVKPTNNQRKRSLSLTFESKQHHFKRRRKEEFVRPTKFLLGGNSRDPLNLGSLADERINKALNEHTPESSPLPTPKHRKEEIEVLIPSNIRDPLNLSMPDDDLAERALVSPNAVMRKKRGRNRKRRRTNSASEVLDARRNSPELRTLTLDLPVVKPVAVEVAESHVAAETKPESSTSTREFKDLKLKPEAIRHCRRPEDKIVSPVVPQPGARKRCGFFPRSLSKESTAKTQSQRPFSRCPSKESQMAGSSQLNNNPEQSCSNHNVKEVKRFQYGNYDRYYGYRNPNCEDLRLRSFWREWFEDKDVLDIGCNAGHVTLCVARDFNPNQIVGIDIDPKLISIARKNIKTYSGSHPNERQFPVSMPLMYGSIPSTNSSAPSSRFPGNVSFVQGNYVPESDEFLQMVQPEYDAILCLSVTKWIHLNWKDAGLKRFFHRIFAHLRPGGKLILEAQGWASYNKRKKLTETIAQNYAAIQLYPERFPDYLLSQVGFSTCEEIATPHHAAKGFRRPIHVFTKLISSCPATPKDNIG